MKKVLKHTMSAAAAGGLLLVLYAMKELFPLESLPFPGAI